VLLYSLQSELTRKMRNMKPFFLSLVFTTIGRIRGVLSIKSQQYFLEQKQRHIQWVGPTLMKWALIVINSKIWNTYQIVKCLDPRVLIEEVFLLLSRPRLRVRLRVTLIDADWHQTRVLSSDLSNKRLWYWTRRVVVEVLEIWKRQDRKETYRGHRRTPTDAQHFKLWKNINQISQSCMHVIC